jgi:hypothetical protein
MVAERGYEDDCSLRILIAIGSLFVATMWPCAIVLADEVKLPIATSNVEPVAPPNGYWSEGDPRPFVSAKVDLGIPYGKPAFAFGYGMPHWIWAGADVYAISTLEFAQTYAGLHAASPIFDLSFGARDTWSYGKPFVALPPFTRDEVLSSRTRRARYWAWEGEAVVSAPLPHSALVADFIFVNMLDVPQGQYVYDESYRFVVKDPVFYVLRLAAVARFLNQDSLKVGVLAVHAFGTGRGQGVWQLGPAADFQLTDHTEIVFCLALQVSGPDSLGLSLGAYGIAGFRYRWATGEKSPKLPWSGPLIP